MTDDTPLWLFADQLGPAVYGGEHAHREVLLVEATSALAKRRYHRQKLHLVLSALRHADRDLGERATLIKADTYTDALQGSSVRYSSTSPRRTPPNGSSTGSVNGVWSKRSCRPRRSRCRARTSRNGPANAPASAWRTSTATSVAASTC